MSTILSCVDLDRAHVLAHIAKIGILQLIEEDEQENT